MGDVQHPVPVCGPCPFRVMGAEQVEEYRHRAFLGCPAVARQRCLPLLVPLPPPTRVRLLQGPAPRPLVRAIPLPDVAFHSPWVPGRHEDRRVRLLYRLGHGSHTLEMIVLALPVKYLCCPTFLDDLHRFSAPAQVAPLVPAQASADRWEDPACSGLEEHPTLGEDVHHSHILSQTDWVPVRQPE